MATVKELRATAKELNIVGYSKMKKADLEDAIAKVAANEIIAEAPVSAVEDRKTIPGDGMMICSLTYAATMACAMRVITENEYDVFVSQIATVNTLEEAYENIKLRKLIQKVPSVFQIRHEGCKGIVVKYPLEFVPELADKDLVVTEGARKFASQNWEEAPLEVCNYLKRKDEWVALNPQFIQALKFENPNALIPVVDFWFNKLEESVSDIAKAQEFHGIISSVDGASDTNSNLVVALRNSADLVDDFQVINWRKAQYEKFITDMKVGRVLVPGEYTYMVCDPAYMLNDIYGLQLDSLKSREYWFNNHVGFAGAFRSPLIAPFEAQKFNCVEREDFWYYKDIVIFNGFDGAWENMGGGDFDGDTCAIVPDSTDLGKIIVDGIRSMNYVVWEPGLSAVKEEFSWENLAKFNAKVAKVDRTGIITNYASRAMDISNHLESAIYFAKKMNCVGIYMIHPSQIDNSGEMKPHVEMINGERYFAIRGFVHATEKDSAISYDPNGIYGIKTFEDVQQIADEYLAKVEYLRLMQGREIDSAKTGVAAEGMSGLDFVDSVKVEFTPQEMITRVEVLGRPVAKFAKLNKYQSLSPLARVHDYVEQKSLEFMNRFANGSDKVALLLKLLSAEENAQLRKSVSFADGRTMTLLDYLKSRKSEYGKKMSEIFKAELPDEELKDIINGLKANEIESLNQLAENVKVSVEVIAVACYIVAYTKDGNFGTGLTYGWLLFNELLSVFTRNNKKFELYRLPRYAEEVSVSAGYLYVNDKKYAPIENVDDCEYVPVQLINGKPYALIHKRSEKVTEIKKTEIESGRIYTIDRIYGFRYSCGSKDDWKRIVRESGYQFTVGFDNNSRLSIFTKREDIINIARNDLEFACKVAHVEYDDKMTIEKFEKIANDIVIGAIKATVTDLRISELTGYEVKITTSPDYSETESTIANLVVRVVK